MTDQPETTRADLERLLSEITPGPWAHRRHWFDDDKAEVYPTHGGKPPSTGQYAEIAEVSTHDYDKPEVACSNARAIAMLPDLLAEVIAAQARIAELEAPEGGFGVCLGSSAVRHMREMYPAAYDALGPSGRRSLRNYINSRSALQRKEGDE